MLSEQLIHDCAKNDIKAQEQLYRLLSPKLFGVCLKYSRSYEEAQDHLQDGFLIIFDKIRQFNFKGSFEGWARRIMINNVLQQYRGVRFMEVADENLRDTTDEEQDMEIDPEVPMDFLVRIIQELPDRYRLVFNLYVVDGFTHKDIADMLDITAGTSKSNLARARVILKQKIEAYLTLRNRTAR